VFMLCIREEQFSALESDFEDRFQKKLIAEVLSLCPRFQSSQEVEKFIEPLVSQARDYGFSTQAEIAAYVLVVCEIGEEKLFARPSFQLAGFDVTASPTQRAQYILDCLSEGDDDGRA
jgi:hypothetical protein